MAVIQQVAAVATTIITAVELQSAATGVTQAARSTGIAATQVLTEADKLARQAAMLQGEVDTFVTEVKAA